MNRYRKNQQTIPEMIIVGFFKALWFLITLPFRGFRFGGKRGLNLEEKKYIITKRHEIENIIKSEKEIELKHAVMEADKLVDYSLKNSGFAGETFAERLKNARQSMPYPVYDNIWKGHKIRNQIAHEQEYRLSKIEYREAVKKLLNYF